MNAFAILVEEIRRREILCALAQDKGYEHNEGVLQTVLRLLGYTSSRDQVRTSLGWLAEQGFITLREVGGYKVATLIARGADVASGAAIVPGVKRPDPKG